MNKREIIDFFDRCAPEWDAHMIKDETIVETILDNCSVSAGSTVLDVACGTGVLFKNYIDRNVSRVLAVDISPKMIEIAKSKTAGTQIEPVCADIECMEPKSQFDCVVVYNAFPHFSNPDGLIHTLTGFLKPGGKLTIAHGMSRAKIDEHHSGSAAKVSMGLMDIKELEVIFNKYCTVCCSISNDYMYQLVGLKEE